MRIKILLISVKDYLKKIPKILWVIIFFGFLIRFIGIWYGLPLALNIDEPSVVSSALGLKHNLNPERFDWPHLYFYINGFAYFIFYLFRKFLSLFVTLPDVWYSTAPFFFVSRLVTVFLGTSTIFVIYYLGNLIFKNQKVALLSALIISVLPIHVYESHLAKLDVAQTFFVSLSLIFIYKVYQSAKTRDFILSGIFIGLTTSTKYNGFLLFIILLLAYLLHFKRNKKAWFKIKNILNLIYSGIVSVIVFFIGTPYALLDHKLFWSHEYGKGVLWQFQNVGKLPWEVYPISLYETFFVMFKQDLGFFIWVIFITLIILFLFFNKRDDKTTLLLFPVIIISFYISRFNRSPSHYFLFLSPMYVLVIGKFIYDILVYSKEKLKFSKKYTNLLLHLLVFILILPSLLISVSHTYYFSKRDTRNIAYKWVKNNLPDEKDSDYLYVVGDKLDVVPFRKNQTSRIKKLDRSNIKESPPLYVIIGEYGLKKEDLTTGDRDPETLKGNSKPILKDADLLLFVDNSDRLGPPIFIFKVNSIEED